MPTESNAVELLKSTYAQVCALIANNNAVGASPELVGGLYKRLELVTAALKEAGIDPSDLNEDPLNFVDIFHEGG